MQRGKHTVREKGVLFVVLFPVLFCSFFLQVFLFPSLVCHLNLLHSAQNSDHSGLTCGISNTFHPENRHFFFLFPLPDHSL